MTTHSYPSQHSKLLAFHCRPRGKQWTPMGGTVEIPPLVYEVTESVEEGGSPLYEGWIFDANTKEMILKRPYQSTFAQAFVTWWTNETGTEPPEELLSRRGYAHDERTER
ncbi:MAG: hypothetical protein L0G70_10205 [Rubrobacter sp.]|nr:hypothetical protein [Rubrobacter sp.]